MIATLEASEFTVDLIKPIFEEVAGACEFGFTKSDLNFPHIIETWKDLMRQDMAKTWVGYVDREPVGVLGGLFITEFYTGLPMAMEQFWGVLKARRKGGMALRLFRAFEKEALRRGVKTIWAGNNRFHAPEGMGKLYERLGYTHWGATYRKVVSF